MQIDLDLDPPRLASPLSRIEPLLTVAEASRIFNLKAHVLRRAIPAYRLADRRIRLRASDINAAIDASRRVGGK